jgi:uncharacterized protein (TIGR02145 family)
MNHHTMRNTFFTPQAVVLVAAILLMPSCKKDDDRPRSSGGGGGGGSGLPSYLNAALSYGTVTDQDGNSYYTIQIGGQEWMAQNLRTTTYANGDPIPNVMDDLQWGGLTTGAWAHYQNNGSYENPYGKLYNWYAVADPRNVCPNNWHVPTDVEWQQLELALGMPVFELNDEDFFRGEAQNVGGRMKSTGTQYWILNEGATNESGFSGLPSGIRYNALGGYFDGVGSYLDLWSASESGAENAWGRNLSPIGAGIGRYAHNKGEGSCVRCVRD